MTNGTQPSRTKTWLDRLCGREGLTVTERRDLRKSWVRVVVTYLAAAYVFIGTPILCYLLFNHATDTDGNAVPGIDEAKDLFLMVLPIASGILGYWFATRGGSPGK